MIDSIVPPESPHETISGSKSLSNTSSIPVAPPSLDSPTSSSSSSMTSLDSATTSVDLVSSPNPTCMKRPRTESPPTKKKKCVRFSQFASVHVVENACQDWSVEEQSAMWYSKQNLQRQRKTAHQLAETMHFYSDDDLMDRFGLVSIQRQLDRLKEVRNIADCVFYLYHDYGMTSWDNVPIVVGVGEWEAEDQQKLLQRYHLVTQLSLRLALRRAAKLAKSLIEFDNDNTND